METFDFGSFIVGMNIGLIISLIVRLIGFLYEKLR